MSVVLLSQGAAQGVAICQKQRLPRCHIELSRRRFTDMIFPGRHGLPGRPRAFLANQASSRTQWRTPGCVVAWSDELSNKGTHQGDFWGPIHSEDHLVPSARAGLIYRMRSHWSKVCMHPLLCDTSTFSTERAAAIGWVSLRLARHT